MEKLAIHREVHRIQKEKLRHIWTDQAVDERTSAESRLFGINE
ncbi:hypothetical protein WMW72_21790 [Paenibacillus filicis]|uniref:Uncharacterized protein n=1 Tax=Paenibacillus filicis TaxID=669464 RepID=A0ABU9DQR4_9BACL